MKPELNAMFGTDPDTVLARWLRGALLALLLLAQTAFAQTPVTGEITTNAHWTTADGPYVLTGEVSIQNGATLTLDPGVTVYMAADASLVVQAGSVQALGTAATPIRILSDRVRLGEAAAPGDWGQWVFGPGTANTRLEHVEFAHGRGLAVQGSAPVFNYLDLHDHQGAAVTTDLAASPSGVGNQASGNTLNGVSVPAGDVTGSVRWDLRGIPYEVSSGTVSVGVSPAIHSITPTTVEQGERVSLRVSGTRLEGASASFDRGGLTLAATGNTGGQADFQLTAAPDAELGTASLRLQTDAGELALPDALTVTPMLPAITGITPNAVLVGAGPAAITVTGRNFLSGSEVLFNAAAVPTEAVSASELRATLPNQAASGTVQTQVRFPDPLSPGQYRLSNALTLTVAEQSLGLSPQTLDILRGTGQTLTLQLPIPAPAGGTTINLSSSAPSIAAVPAAVSIPANASSQGFTVTGLAAGTADISASQTGYGSATVTVSITAPLGELYLPFDTNLLDVYGHALTNTGGVGINASNSKWGSGSGAFNSGKRLTSKSADFAFGNADYTIEGWIYLTGGSPGVYGRILETEAYPTEGGMSVVLIPGNPTKLMVQQGYRVSNTAQAVSVNVPNNQWVFFRAGRQGLKMHAQINSTINSGSFSSIAAATHGNLSIGANFNGGEAMNGLLDDLRIIPGYWLGDQPIPTGPFGR